MKLIQEVGEHLKRLRIERGVSVEDMARELGIQKAFAHDLEESDEVWTTLELKAVGKLAHLLEVDATDLFICREEVIAHGQNQGLPFVETLKRAVAANGREISQLSDEIGWDLMAFIQEPATLCKLSAEGLFEICSGLNLDWENALSSICKESSAAD